MSEADSAKAPTGTKRRKSRAWKLPLLFGLTCVATFLVCWVVVTMWQRKSEELDALPRLVALSEISTDPTPWGLNWPHQYDQYTEAAGDRFQGGSSALTTSKLESFPWLKRLYAGYAFSIDYRELRGHAYMLYDQGVTERVSKKPQSGACLHCHASVTALYRKVGFESLGREVTEESLGRSFDQDAVIRGFEELSTKPYHEVLAALEATPDGTPSANGPFPKPPAGGFHGEIAGKPVSADHQSMGDAHPVSCIDCHDPRSMKLRVTRPGFIQGVAALAAGDAPVPHLPSIAKWRKGPRAQPYDPNRDATRQELRSYACAQCHVEYYCASKETLSFPWKNGLRAEDLESVWAERQFPDGTRFHDYRHGETGAYIYKVQHPEFELWSQGIHARAGVSCADCHMPYQRVGASKVSNHAVSSPMEHVSQSCQVCHRTAESELVARVEAIQAKTMQQMDRAATAMTDMLDAILAAKAAGATEAQLGPILELQTKAMWRLDFISSENSKGFHADQEAMRILGESIDYSRQAQAKAIALRAGAAPSTDGLERSPVQGISDPAHGRR